MSKDRSIIKSIVDIIFPLVTALKANRLIDCRIEKVNKGELDFEYMSGYDSLTYKEAEEYLTKTFDARKTIEDKAKTNVLGVTISVTLIMGLSQTLLNSFSMHSGLKVIAIIVGVYALSSMIMATVLSLIILGGFNYVYDISPSDKSAKDIKETAHAAELNSLFNVKRNNFLFTSYKLISNFLFCLLILFLIITFPTLSTKDSLQALEDKQANIKVQVDKVEKVQQTQIQLLQTLERNSQADNNLSKQLELINSISKTQNEILVEINNLQRDLSN